MEMMFEVAMGVMDMEDDKVADMMAEFALMKVAPHGGQIFNLLK